MKKPGRNARGTTRLGDSWRLLAVAGLSLAALFGCQDQPATPAAKSAVQPTSGPALEPAVTPAAKPADALDRQTETKAQAKAKYLPPLVQGYAGVYALQWAIDFDTLDGAVIDPKTNGLSLFGHSAQPDRLLVIPYLDYLATAQECQSPSFSLRWTDESYVEMGRFQQAGSRAILDAVTKLFDEESNLTPTGAWFLRQNGVPVTQGLGFVETLRAMLSAAGHHRIAETLDDERTDLPALVKQTLIQLAGGEAETRVSPALAAKLAGAKVPLVRPEFKGLPADSLLAHLAFQADVAGKFLLSTPELRDVAPGYRTEFAFERAQGRSSQHGYARVWFAPGRFELTQSKEGRLVRFTRSEMTINIRQTDPRTRQDIPDPRAEQYGRELTSQYDALAQAVPVLHVLREAEKIMALTAWLKQRNLAVGLPKAGRQTWNPPQEYPGVVHFTLWVNPKGAMVISSSAEGGVDLHPKPNVREGDAGKPSDKQIGVPGVDATTEQLERDLRTGLEAARLAKNALLKNRLKGQLAAILCDKASNLWRAGDKEGSSTALNEALRLNPSSPAAKGVYKAWQEPLGRGGPPSGRPNSGVTVPSGTGPNGKPGSFDWSTRDSSPDGKGTEFEEASGKAGELVRGYRYNGMFMQSLLPQVLPLPAKPEDRKRAIAELTDYVATQPELKQKFDDLQISQRNMSTAPPDDGAKTAELVRQYKERLEAVKKEMEKEKYKDSLTRIVGTIKED